jgi:opacity protein-like surface antigen
MKQAFALMAMIALGISTTQSAEAFNVVPFEFVGTAAQCGGTAGTDIVGARWAPRFGLGDNPSQTDANKNALLLSKNGPTTDCSSAGATVAGPGVTGGGGVVVTELGFDVRNGGHCGAGAPRFNIEVSQVSQPCSTNNPCTFHFVGGCSAGTHLADTPQDGWTRVTFDAALLLSQGVPAGSRIKSLSILFDEGVDTGPDFSGFVMLDNINVNGTRQGKP